MKRQGEAFGAEFLLAEALSLDAFGDIKTVSTDKGDFFCLGILIATGARPRAVGFKGALCVSFAFSPPSCSV